MTLAATLSQLTPRDDDRELQTEQAIVGLPKRRDRVPRAPTSTRSSPKTCRLRSRDPRQCAPKSRRTRMPDGRNGLRKEAREIAGAVRSSSWFRSLHVVARVLSLSRDRKREIPIARLAGDLFPFRSIGS